VNDRRLLILCTLLLVLIGGAAASYLHNRPLPGEPLLKPIDIRKDPIQTEIRDPLPIPFDIPRVSVYLTPRAAFSVDGLIVASDRYRHDLAAPLAPRDLTLVWGRVPEHLDAIKFSHGHRFFMFNYNNNAPFDQNYISRHATNIHLIPASDNLRRAILRASEHQPIRLSGFLVDIAGSVRKRSFTWRTSMTRDDTGDGACEVLYVREIGYDGKVYR
jgi:hypothetical protein